MKRLAAGRGIALAVILLPTKGEVYRWLLDEREPVREDSDPSGFAEAILEACDRLGLRCFDSKPYLVERARLLLQESGSLLWWRDDTHLNDHGHEAVAAFIAEQVLNLRSRELIANQG
jgi:lysophospholipase L1-like esterase